MLKIVSMMHFFKSQFIFRARINKRLFYHFTRKMITKLEYYKLLLAYVLYATTFEFY